VWCGALFLKWANFRRNLQGWFEGGLRIRGIFVFGETQLFLMLRSGRELEFTVGNRGGALHLDGG